MKILIAEDEAPTVSMLSRIAEDKGHEIVAVCTSAQEACEAAQRHAVDLALLDINLCGPEDGIECGRKLLRYGNPKLIYLTSCTDDATVAEAMRTDPLNYLVKPLSERDIAIALSLAERHIQKTAPDMAVSVHRFGEAYRYRAGGDEVEGPDGTVVLSHRELRLLKLLLHAGRNCIESETIARSFGSEPLEAATVRSLVRRLRRKLPGAVETVKGYGYRIAAIR